MWFNNIFDHVFASLRVGETTIPFIEIQGPPVAREARAALARGATDALVAAYAIDPGLVVTYFIDVETDWYAFGGVLGGSCEAQRVFVKVYALPRIVERRRAAAQMITDAICGVTGWEGENVIIYFLEVDPDSAAHAGLLQSDHAT